MIKRLLIKLISKSTSKRYIKYLRKKGMKIGAGTTFLSPNHTYIDEGRAKWISIGNNCVICKNVTILAHDYSWSTLIKSHGIFLPTGGGQVAICNNVFIGEGSFILRNVTIGSNVIIGASSVVTKDIPSNSVVAGIPAKVVMTLEDYYNKRKSGLLEEAKKNFKFLLDNGIEVDEVSMKNFRPLYMERNELNINRYLVENGNIGIDSKELKYYLNSTKPMFNGFPQFIEYLRSDSSNHFEYR